MLAKTNKMLRTELIESFKRRLGEDDTNLYLVFSYNSNRSSEDLVTDLTEADMTSVTTAPSPTIKPIYALRVTSSQLYALYEYEGVSSPGVGIVVGTEEFKGENSLPLVNNQSWSALYFNKNISPVQADYDDIIANAGSPTFNVVSVISGLKAPGDNLATADVITDFTYFYFSTAKLLMQSRPANTNLLSNLPNQDLPVLIKL